MQRLAGKRALVTGGSRGIGAAIARRLAEEGADVAVTYERSAEQAGAVARSIEALGRRSVAIKADSGDPAAIKTAVDEAARTLGGLDILVNNAGIYTGGPLEDTAPEAIDRIIAVNLRAVILASQAALAHLGTGGRIISTGSCLAERVPFAGISLYAMTKAALIGFTKGLARDLGPKGITVNVVHPGPIDTDMNPADGDHAAGQRQLLALGHYGEARDIAAAVAFLASEDGRFVTGTGLAVDGGANA